MPVEPVVFHEPIDSRRYGASALDEALAAGMRDRLGRFVGMAVLTQADEAFFDALVHFLATAFDADLVFVGAVDSPFEPRHVRTLAAFEGGERMPDFEYDLAGTPCADVLTSPSACLYSSQAADLFPGDAILVDMGVQGYCGIPMLSRDNRLIGILAVLTRHAIDDPEVLMAILRVYGSRASLELEHLLAMERGADDPGYERLRTERDQELNDALMHLRTL